jgi:YD repeat-containing protein
LVSQITFKQGTELRMTTTKQFDYVSRLRQVNASPAAAGQSALTWNYRYNRLSQRTRIDLADGSYWVFGYDDLGQLSSAKGFESGSGSRAQEPLTYGYDLAGNLQSRTNNGLVHRFTVNNALDRSVDHRGAQWHLDGIRHDDAFSHQCHSGGQQQRGAERHALRGQDLRADQRVAAQRQQHLRRHGE